MKRNLYFIYVGMLIGSLLVILSIGGCSKPPPKPQAGGGYTVPTSAFPMGMGREKPATITPTILPEGVTPEAYVEQYYQLLKEKKYKEAFEMAPVETRQRDTTENFARARESMPIKKFKVLKAEKIDENTIQVPVELELGGMAQGSIWITTWTFKKQGDKWIVQKTFSLPKK